MRADTSEPGAPRRRAAAALAAVVLAALVAALAPAQSPGQSGEQVRIHRDALGVPHVEAASANGLAYGTGYALAQDRLFLTVAIRLTGQGRTTELLGPSVLAADVAMRRDFYDPADVQRQYEALPEGRRAELQAFADGFNRGMAEVMADPRRRPAAFDALGYQPEPWKPVDSLAVTMLFTYAIFAGEGGAGQLGNAALLGRLEERFGARRALRIWDDLLFKHDPRAPTVIPRGEAGRPPRSLARERLPGRAQLRVARAHRAPLAKAARVRAAETERVLEVLRRLPLPKIGSYGLAASGRRTASGGGLLIGSPQASLTAPPVFWQVGQHAPGRACTGFTVPGLGPWTGIGWCNGHAWTLVAGNMGEQVDHYVVRTDPEHPRRYWHRGGWREMDVRREELRVNRCVPPVCAEPNAPRTEVVEIESTVHGPVVFRDDEQGVAVAQRRAQRGIWAQSLNAVAGWNEARSLAEFERATDAATGTYNLLYADADGHAMYRFTGVQPVRAPGVDRRLPSPGAGEHEWRSGHLRGRRLPRVVDPRSGLLVSNQGIESKPADWWPNSSSVLVGQVSRVADNRRIAGGAGRLDVDAAERINPLLLERRDAITAVFARHLRTALARTRDPRLREAAALYEEWARAGHPRVDADGDGLYDHPAVAIFGADNFNMRYARPLWTRLMRLVFEDELGEPGSDGSPGSFRVPGPWLGQLSTLKIALDGRRGRRRLARDYVDDLRTRRRERGTALVRAALAHALQELEQEFETPDMRRWLRAVPEVPFEPLGLVAPPPIRGFDHGTYSQIVDPRAGVGRYILPPGNGSADAAHEIALAQGGTYPEHFADQRERYEAYGFFPMPHAPEQFRAAPEGTTELAYGG